MQALRERKSAEMKSVKGEIIGFPKIDDVVLLKEEPLPRGKWRIGKVIELIKSDADNVEPAVELLLPSGRKLRRPFKYLYPLELGIYQ